MGSEKSATQLGNVATATAGVGSNNKGGGVGVRGWRGITDGGRVEASADRLAGSGVDGASLTLQARAVKIMIPEKKKDFINFIFTFPMASILLPEKDSNYSVVIASRLLRTRTRTPLQ
jgi:hypothetical protein